MAQKVTRVPYAYCYRCHYGMEYPSCDMYCVKYLKKLFESPEYGIYDPTTKTNSIAAIIVEPAQFLSLIHICFFSTRTICWRRTFWRAPRLACMRAAVERR